MPPDGERPSKHEPVVGEHFETQIMAEGIRQKKRLGLSTAILTSDSVLPVG